MQGLKEHIINELGLSERDWLAFKNVLLEVHNNKDAPITVNSIEKVLKDQRIYALGNQAVHLL